jgi:hypothetical protein
MTSSHALRILAGALVFSACVSHATRGQGLTNSFWGVLEVRR